MGWCVIWGYCTWIVFTDGQTTMASTIERRPQIHMFFPWRLLQVRDLILGLLSSTLCQMKTTRFMSKSTSRLSLSSRYFRDRKLGAHGQPQFIEQKWPSFHLALKRWPTPGLVARYSRVMNGSRLCLWSCPQWGFKQWTLVWRTQWNLKACDWQFVSMRQWQGLALSHTDARGSLSKCHRWQCLLCFFDYSIHNLFPISEIPLQFN